MQPRIPGSRLRPRKRRGGDLVEKQSGSASEQCSPVGKALSQLNRLCTGRGWQQMHPAIRTTLTLAEALH